MIYDVGIFRLSNPTPYIIHYTSYINRATGSCLAEMSGSFICGFVVLMEPVPFGSGFLFLGGEVIKSPHYMADGQAINTASKAIIAGSACT